LKGAKDLVTAVFEMQDKIIAPMQMRSTPRSNAVETQQVYSPTQCISIFKAWAGSRERVASMAKVSVVFERAFTVVAGNVERASVWL
jgi:hypothetical protein